MELKDRVKLLLAKLNEPVVITDDPVVGFEKAWAEPGFGPAIKYLNQLALDRLALVLNRLDLDRLALVLNRLDLDRLDDSTKSKICDVFGIEK